MLQLVEYISFLLVHLNLTTVTKSSCVSHIYFVLLVIKAHLKTHCPEFELTVSTGSVNVCCTLCDVCAHFCQY